MTDNSRFSRVAYFPQDLIGDSLVWANLPKAMAECFTPCEVTVFCTKGVAELFGRMTFCNTVIEYDPAKPWSAEEATAFGRFDTVLNTRYDADSAQRVEALDHERAYGFENIDIPEAVCRRVYTDYIPLSRWDDYHLRRETSVTEQGAELVRLYDPGYHCEFVELGKTEFVREPPEDRAERRIVFVLGASDPAKSWGLENYLELARRVLERGFRPMFLLGPKEAGLAEKIAITQRRRDAEREDLSAARNAKGAKETPAQRPQSENKTSRTSRTLREDNAGFEVGVCLPFRKIAGLFDPDYGTRCVVGNDTGLMHLACMLGAPSVTIMPHGHHFTWFPYGADERARHVCLAPACATPMCVSECGETAKCAGKIQVEQVLDGIEEVTK